jgi:hypothetical protein
VVRRRFFLGGSSIWGAGSPAFDFANLGIPGDSTNALSNPRLTLTLGTILTRYGDRLVPTGSV